MESRSTLGIGGTPSNPGIDQEIMALIQSGRLLTNDEIMLLVKYPEALEGYLRKAVINHGIFNGEITSGNGEPYDDLRILESQLESITSEISNNHALIKVKTYIQGIGNILAGQMDLLYQEKFTGLGNDVDNAVVIDDLVEEPENLSEDFKLKTPTAPEGVSVFVSREEIERKYGEGGVKESLIVPTTPVRYDVQKIRGYLEKCNAQFEEYGKKHDTTEIDLLLDEKNQGVLLSNPAFIFTIAEKILNLPITAEKFEKNRQYREGIYKTYLRLNVLLKKTRGQVVGDVKETAEYLLEKLKTQANSIQSYYHKDHPENSNSKNNHGGAQK